VKAIVLTAVLAGAGGAGIALLAAQRPAASASSPPATDPGGALAAALASLEREVEALRKEIREGAPLRGGPAGPGGGPGEASIRAPRAVDGEVPAAAAAAAVVRSPGAAVPSSGSLAERIAPVRGWHKSPETRVRWTFLSEAEVLERFGVPDRVELEGEAERWNYMVPAVDDEGNAYTDQVILVLNRGRLVTVYD
jgi:hypothetical protein